ncbi:nickel/cobalt transporter [Breoghania sp.]|uniref:nickel/cobalt transporter n=1 Tax=Breoghania sp. TaxID=2065378 RepID=UPI002AA85253|nr:nickel/cobalt transporter [Breoghania sp.]
MVRLWETTLRAGIMRRTAVLIAVTLALPFAIGPAAMAAPSPFGVGLPEAQAAPGGWFSGFFAWVAVNQSAFYRSLTETLQALKDNPAAGWWLVTLSFLYGVFHAAGPGHGKAVISTYVLANGQTLKKAVALSFASAIAQAVTAIVLIGVAAVALNMTSIAITRTSEIFEIGSYVMITGLGGWLIWSKALRPYLVRKDRGHAHADDYDHGHGHSHDGGVCASCGHAHAPDPAMLREPVTLARAWSVILAVGLRPCTGALIVLVFSLSQGLVLAGVASTFVMALGTGLTVSALAVFAVLARGMAVRFAGESSSLADRIHRGVEIAGAFFVFLLGAILLTATLGWG